MEITENADKLYFCDMEQVNLEMYYRNQENSNNQWKKEKKRGKSNESNENGKNESVSSDSISCV